MLAKRLVQTMDSAIQVFVIAIEDTKGMIAQVNLTLIDQIKQQHQIFFIAESLFQNEQLWKIESSSRSLKHLKDKAGLKDILIANLPDLGKDGFITNAKQEVLGVSNGATDWGAQVKEEKQGQNDLSQKWHRGLEDKDGYFTLENLHSKLFLTVNKESKLLEIKGY